MKWMTSKLVSEQGTPKSIDNKCIICGKGNSDVYTNISAHNRCDCPIDDPFEMKTGEEDIKKEIEEDSKLLKRFQQIVITECMG